jgi:hypothetical protein
MQSAHRNFLPNNIVYKWKTSVILQWRNSPNTTSASGQGQH